MQTKTKALHFDIHGRVMIRFDAEAPAAARLRSMLACFATATATERRADIVVDDRLEPMPDAGLVEHELAYTANSVRVTRDAR